MTKSWETQGNLDEEKASSLLGKFEEHLREAGIGIISEIFDGEPPHLPRRCISQAQSVAEILRALVKNLPSI